MEECITALTASKIKKGGDHSKLFEYLAKNILEKSFIHITSLKILVILSEKMGQEFIPCINLVIKEVLMKYKDNRGVLVLQLDAITKNVAQLVDLTHVKDDIVEAVQGNGSAGVKAASGKLIGDLVVRTYLEDLCGLDDIFLPLLKPFVED
jgi:hypothetical protein